MRQSELHHRQSTEHRARSQAAKELEQLATGDSGAVGSGWGWGWVGRVRSDTGRNNKIFNCLLPWLWLWLGSSSGDDDDDNGNVDDT